MGLGFYVFLFSKRNYLVIMGTQVDIEDVVCFFNHRERWEYAFVSGSFTHDSGFGINGLG